MNPKLKKFFRFVGGASFLVLILYAGYTAGTMRKEEANKAVVPSTKYGTSLNSSDSPLEGIVEEAFAALSGPTINTVGNIAVNGTIVIDASRNFLGQIEPRISDPVSPPVGRIWLRTDL